jgi:hypothetical protein
MPLQLALPMVIRERASRSECLKRLAQLGGGRK